MAAGGLYIPLKAVFDDKGFKDAQKSMGALGSTMKKTLGAAGIGLGVAAISRQLQQAVKAAEKVQISNQRLNQVAKSMGLFGAATAATTKRLQAYADSLELTTGVEAETIKLVQAKLLTFKNIGITATQVGGQFDIATQAALNLAATGFGTAESNAVQLGKALQDPIKGITALARAGVTFTDDEKKKIRALVESNKMFEAQTMILDALETQVGGVAEATASASDKIRNAFGQVEDAVGMALMPYLNEFAEWLATPPGQEKLQAIAQTFVSIVTAVGNMVSFLLDNTWLVKTVAGLIAMYKVWKAIFLVTKAIYGAEKASALAIFVKKGAESAKGWAAIAAAAAALAAGIGTFVALDAMIGSIGGNVEQLDKDIGKLNTYDAPPIVLPPVDDPSTTKGKPSAQVAAEVAAKAASTALVAYQKLAMSMMEFKASLGEVLSGVRPLETATRIIGDFEQASVDAFTSVQEKIAEALKSGLISSATYVALTRYAAREAKVLNEIAAKRDAIAKKIDIAKNLVSTVRDYVNISDLGATSAEITGGFRSIIDKTVAFGKNLLELKKAGLDSNLFAQILGAGLEAGGQTAQAIVDGGDSAVTELNGLFKELNLAAESIAMASTDFMYSVGEEIISNGFIAGLMDQDSALVKAAQALADAFTSTFTTGLSVGMADQLARIQPPSVSVPMSSTVTPLSGGMASQLAQLGFKNTQDAFIRRDSMGQSFLTTKAGINITVNAGIGTDGKSVAQSIIDEIKRYERANGAVWTAAA